MQIWSTESLWGQGCKEFVHWIHDQSKHESQACQKAFQENRWNKRGQSDSPGLSVFQYNFEFLQLCSQKAFVVPGRFGRRVALGFFAAGVGLLIFRCSPFTHFPPWHMDQVLWCSVRLLIFLNLRGQTQIPTFLSPKKFKLVSDWMRLQGISLWYVH